MIYVFQVSNVEVVGLDCVAICTLAHSYIVTLGDKRRYKI